MSRFALILSFFLVPLKAYSFFDPFTAIMAVSAVVKMASDAAETVGDVAGTIEEANYLLSLIDEGSSGTDLDKRLRALEREYREIESMSDEVGYTAEQMRNDMGIVLSKDANIKDRIRSATQLVEKSKRILAIAKTRGADKTAGLSQVNMDQKLTKVVETLEHIRIDNEEARIGPVKEQLRKKREIYHDRLETLKTATALSRGGSMSEFPSTDPSFENALRIYRSLIPEMLVLAFVILILRGLFYQISFAHPDQWIDLFRDYFVCGFMLIALPELIGFIGKTAMELSWSINAKYAISSNNIIQSNPNNPYSLREFIPYCFYELVWFVKAPAYILVSGAFILLVNFLIAFGPMVVLLGTVMNFSRLLPYYICLLAITMAWPVAWTLLSYISYVSALSGSGILISTLVSLVQITAPFLMYPLAKVALIVPSAIGNFASAKSDVSASAGIASSVLPQGASQALSFGSMASASSGALGAIKKMNPLKPPELKGEKLGAEDLKKRAMEKPSSQRSDLENAMWPGLPESSQSGQSGPSSFESMQNYQSMMEAKYAPPLPPPPPTQTPIQSRFSNLEPLDGKESSQ